MTDTSAVLGAATAFHGEIEGGEDLLILGRVEGKINVAKHSVTVGKTASLKADVVANRISVEGEVTGDLTASESVSIRASANVVGNIRAPRVAAEDGCRIKGSIEITSKGP